MLTNSLEGVDDIDAHRPHKKNKSQAPRIAEYDTSRVADSRDSLHGRSGRPLLPEDDRHEPFQQPRKRKSLSLSKFGVTNVSQELPQRLTSSASETVDRPNREPYLLRKAQCCKAIRQCNARHQKQKEIIGLLLLVHMSDMR
jgi:hypothetical protein